MEMDNIQSDNKNGRKRKREGPNVLVKEKQAQFRMISSLAAKRLFCIRIL
jgi:hypothetical protein